MKKLFRITCLIFFFGMVPVSCLKNNCDGIIVRDFRIITFKVSTTDLQGESIDTSVFKSYEIIAKTIEIDRKEDIVSKHLFLENAAYACSPREPNSVNYIKGIELVSKSDFEYRNATDSIKAGDDISSMFIVSQSNPLVFNPIPAYLSSERRLFLNDRIFLSLGNKPYRLTEFRFDIKVTLSDNSIHEFKDQVLKVK